MPKQVPDNWAEDSLVASELPNTPTGEVPIKSEIIYNGNKYAVVTNSLGEYNVYLGGTGILNQQIGSNALIFSRSLNEDPKPGIAWQRADTKNIVGGNAGLIGLQNLAQKQVSEGLFQYLTPEEFQKLNPELIKEIQTTDPNPTITENIDPNDADLFEVTTKDFDSGGQYNNKFLVYPLSINSSQDRINISQRRYRVNNRNLSDRFKTPADPTQELIGTVVLPMPNNLTESNATGWGENSLSTLASMVMGAAVSTVKSNPADFINPNSDVREKVNQFFNDAVKDRIKTSLTLNAAASITKFLGINVDPEAFRSRATGTVINPNLELLFNGPKLRSFGFEFKMTPRSEDEARNIRYIIKFFKKGMAAVSKSSKSEGFYLGAPNVFDIEFKSEGNRLNSIGKIKTCALQQFNVNYTPEGFYAAYVGSELAPGSQPISVIMQLAFTELTPMYNSDYTRADNTEEGVN